MKRFALLVAVVLAGMSSRADCQIITPSSQADADAARALAVAERSDADAEYATAFSTAGTSPFYLRGALLHLAASPGPFTLAEGLYSKGDYRSAWLFYTGSSNASTASRRWTAAAMASR